MPTVNSPTPDATTTTKGKIQLIGALTGTASAPRLNTGAATSTVATAEGTTSTSYVDLTTVGPAVTATINANGLALVTVTSLSFTSAAGIDAYMSLAISGATTVAATDTRARSSNGTAGITCSGTFLVSGLTAGSNTFTAKYRTSSGTSNFLNRSIVVVPL